MQPDNRMTRSSRSLTLVIALSGLAASTFGGCAHYLYGPSLTKIPKHQSRVIDEQRGDTRELELSAAVQVYDVRIAAGSRVGFEHGRMQWIRSKEPQQIDGTLAPTGSTVYVEEQQHTWTARTFALQSVKLGDQATYAGLTFRAGDNVRFDRERRPSSVYLGGGDRDFGAETYREGTELWFNKAGEVTRVVTPEARAKMDERDAACRQACAHFSGDPWVHCYNRCAGY